ncbi:MAG: hypothetical protein ACYSVY_13145, partial [Planctomycetota bacterium]
GAFRAQGDDVPFLEHVISNTTDGPGQDYPYATIASDGSFELDWLDESNTCDESGHISPTLIPTTGRLDLDTSPATLMWDEGIHGCGC